MKRTMISTLLCAFVIIGCMLSFSSCLGSKVCQHEYDDVYDTNCNVCGETREAAPQVTGAELSANGDTIIIKYDNGTSQSVGNAKYCKHSTCTIVSVVKEHYEDENGNKVPGTYIYHCAECNSYKSETAIIHKEIEGTAVMADATCESPATKTYECFDCGTVVETTGKALGHKADDSWSIIYDDSKNVCEDGGVLFGVCARCNTLTSGEAITPKPIEEQGWEGAHTVKVWTLTKAPTDTEEGLLTGDCVARCCGKTITYVLPAITAEAYDIDEHCEKALANCALKIEGCDNYKYILAEGGEAVDKLIIEAAVFVKHHTVVIDGETVEIDLDKIYDADSKNGDVKVFGELSSLLCKDSPIEANFTCAACNAKCTARVERSHSVNEEAWTIIESPSCTKNGIKSNICTVDGCGIVVEAMIPATGHNYNYNLVCTEENGEYICALSGVCACEECVVYSNDEIADKVVILDISNSTCTKEGSKEFSIALDASFETEQESASCTLTIATTNHYFGDIIIVEGNVYSDSELESIINDPIIVANITGAFKCGENSLKIPCQGCENALEIKILMPHTPGEDLKETPATCTTSGERTYTCAKCNEVQSEVIPATGHDRVSIIANDVTYFIRSVCTICKDEIRIDLTKLEENFKAPTCSEEGYDSYIGSDGVVYSVPVSMIPHKVAGIIIDKNIYVPSDLPGIELPKVDSCTDPIDATIICDNCKQSIAIKLVKAHEFSDDADETNDVAPSCTEDGYKLGKCICGEIGVYETIAATGHKYNSDCAYADHDDYYSYSISKKQLTYKCVTCGDEDVINSVIRTIVQPECDTEGKLIYSYSNGKIEIVLPKIVGADVHTAPVEPDSNGAYLVDGDKVHLSAIRYCTNEVILNGGYYICTECNERVLCDVILPHNPAEDAEITVLKAPTCTEDGMGVYKCAYCPEEFDGSEAIIEVIPATGHIYANGFTVEAVPTINDTGIATGICTVESCGAAHTETLPVLSEDNYTIVTVLANSCFATGIDGYTYTFDFGSVYFEVVTDIFVYVPGETEELSYDVKEAVTFIDPFGEEKVETVEVVYTFYRCNNTECTAYHIIGKSFEYDDNTYVYNFDENKYELVIVDDEEKDALDQLYSSKQ